MLGPLSRVAPTPIRRPDLRCVGCTNGRLSGGPGQVLYGWRGCISAPVRSGDSCSFPGIEIQRVQALNRIARYVFGLAGTLGILAFVPTNIAKLLALMILWTATFWPLSRTELAFAGVVCVFFTGMNAAALKQGIFSFSDPDVLGMPVYEVFMWGFYLLHTKRVIGGPAPEGRRAVAWTLALLFALAFATLTDPQILLGATSLVLLVALYFFHEPLDLAYAGYMVLLGVAIEYTGVLSGLWFYPGDPLGGVPPWFITMWGGIGLFLRRLALPIVSRYEVARTPFS